MKQLNSQQVTPALPEQLQRRMESLGIAVIRLAREDENAAARVQIVGHSSWIDRLLLDSPLFEKALVQNWDQINEPESEIVRMWSGFALVPLRGLAQRRGNIQSHYAAVLVSDKLLESEQLHVVCREHEIDYKAAVSRIDTTKLIADHEVTRLASLLSWMRGDVEVAGKQERELQGLSRELADSYEELSLLYKMSTNMTLDQPPAQFLVNACEEIQEVLGLRWMALQLIGHDPRLNELSDKLLTSGAAVDRKLVYEFGKHVLNRDGGADIPPIIENPETVGVQGLESIASDMLAVPLTTDDGVLGLLFGGDKLDGEKLSSIDVKLCGALAGSLSIFIENTMLYDDMQAMFMGVLQALTVAIDAKDSYTHGHSERVALMSKLLAVRAGLDPHQVERVYLSGLVHDVGKIGVPESVLCKPGRLTLDEFEQIKLHPEIGARIIADIRQMQDLVPGVMHHHERWDGRGYPHGLAGTDIPMFGRLICLADAFDAMSSDRTYRKSRGHEEVLEEVARCAGTQFDPDLAKLFVDLDFGPFFELIQKHRSEADRRDEE